MDALGNTVRSFNYNARNQILKNTDALGNSDSYQYDVLGRLSKDSDPLSNSAVDWADKGSPTCNTAIVGLRKKTLSPTCH